jgi:hypothetical protein
MNAAIPHRCWRPWLIQRLVVLQDLCSYFAFSTCTWSTIAPYKQEGGHVQLVCLILSPALSSRAASVLRHGRRLVSICRREPLLLPTGFMAAMLPRNPTAFGRCSHGAAAVSEPVATGGKGGEVRRFTGGEAWPLRPRRFALLFRFSI